MQWTLTSHSKQETHRIGALLGALSRPGDVLLLEGPLGGGKTSLTQGVAGGMGITAPVTSPTFVLVNEYQEPRRLYHIDLYRIDSPAEAGELGLDEYFFGRGVSVVEWPDRAPAAMPPEYLHIRMDHTGVRRRRLAFTPKGLRYVDLLRQLQQVLAQAQAMKAPAKGRARPA